MAKPKSKTMKNTQNENNDKRVLRRCLMTTERFGEILAANIQHYRENNEGQVDIHLFANDEEEEFGVVDNSDVEGLMGALIYVGSYFIEIKESDCTHIDMDVYDSKEDPKPYLQMDATVDYSTRRMTFEDVRFSKVFAETFGYSLETLWLTAYMLTGNITTGEE